VNSFKSRSDISYNRKGQKITDADEQEQAALEADVVVVAARKEVERLAAAGQGEEEILKEIKKFVSYRSSPTFRKEITKGYEAGEGLPPYYGTLFSFLSRLTPSFPYRLLSLHLLPDSTILITSAFLVLAVHQTGHNALEQFGYLLLHGRLAPSSRPESYQLPLSQVRTWLDLWTKVDSQDADCKLFLDALSPESLLRFFADRVENANGDKLQDLVDGKFSSHAEMQKLRRRSSSSYLSNALDRDVRF
jgi:hypothetical protein